MRNIQQNSLRYRILFILMKFAFKRFFRKVNVRGLENIPIGHPVIFAPNHQSGLIDPLLVLFYQNDFPIVFMARADIFKNKLAASLLRFLKIMPVFRIRDGFENLEKNEESFNEAKGVLLDSKYLCLMPEGNHGHQHKLRPLVKGMFRIAFSALESLPTDKEVFIVPVGIDHSYYQHAGSDIVISYGKPIRVKEYEAAYREHPATAMNALRIDLAERISLLMHDIRSEKRYDLVYKLSCLGTPTYLEARHIHEGSPSGAGDAGMRFDARRELGMKLDELDRTDSPLLSDWNALCTHLNQLPVYPNQLVEWMDDTSSIHKRVAQTVITLFAFPGIIMNSPAWFINHLACKSIEDKQMHNTFAFAVGFIINPLMYILVGITIGINLHHTWLLTLSEIGLIGLYATWCEQWRQRIRLPFTQWKYNLNKHRRHLVKQCKTDYFFLKQSMRNWIMSN